jgi:hypothetical protein
LPEVFYRNEYKLVNDSILPLDILDSDMRKLRFDRRVLIVGKRNALFEYGRRTMLVDKFFKPVEKSRAVAPNLKSSAEKRCRTL